jgi:pectate lyase-like protein
MKRLLCLLPPLFGVLLASAAPSLDVYSVRDFGAKGDGTNDDTAAFQKALDTASQAGGGTVMAERGNYFFAGHLNVPKSVCLQGMWKSVTSHIGVRNPGQASKPTDNGTTFLVTENEGHEEGAAFIQLNENSTVSGVVIYYPLQKIDEEPRAYPWSIVMRSKNCAVLDVELLNSYNGIDGTGSERHLIRNVSGQPLRRGIQVDRILDIGRIENVHFNPWWTMGTPAYQWQLANGEAFIFGRSDWEYVLNTFCFGYKIGYKFIHTSSGECNGNFLGIGADDCFTAVQVDQSAPFGLLISNGEFTSFHGPDPTMVVVGATNRGAVRFSNCAFWGPCNQIAKIAGRGTVGFSDCTFCEWDHANEGRSALQVQGAASVLVRGCEFQANKPQIELGTNVLRAVFADNMIRGKLRVTNHSSRQFQIHDNATDEPTP